MNKEEHYVLYTAPNIVTSAQIKDDEIARECGMNVKDEKCTRKFSCKT